MAIVFIDLDGFKAVNDTLGHEAGDELLCAIAQRIAGAVRPQDTPARFGGDEFAVLLADAGQAAAVAERLRRAIGGPVSVRGRSFGVTASVDLAVAASGVGLEQLLREADLAMYAAKGAGGDRVAGYAAAQRA